MNIIVTLAIYLPFDRYIYIFHNKKRIANPNLLSGKLHT